MFTIIDVCCPFENGPEALEEAVEGKQVKYDHLKTFSESQGKSCDIRRRRHRFSAFWLRFNFKKQHFISSCLHSSSYQNKDKDLLHFIIIFSTAVIVAVKRYLVYSVLFAVIWRGLTINWDISFLDYNFSSAGRIYFKFDVWIVIFVPVLLC